MMTHRAKGGKQTLTVPKERTGLYQGAGASPCSNTISKNSQKKKIPPAGKLDAAVTREEKEAPRM